MGTSLKNIVHYVALPVGVPTALPHLLNENGRAVIPDVLTPGEGAGDVTLTANATNVIATNNGGGPATFDVLCEHWHTIERDFLDAAILELSPQPFVACCGGGSSGGARSQMYTNLTSQTPITVAAGAAVPFPNAGPSVGGGFAAGGVNQFVLPQVGVYRVSWSVAFTAGSQLQAALGGVGIANTVAMAGAGVGEEEDPIPEQNNNTVLIQTAAINALLSIINPTANAQLTVQGTSSGLTHEQAPSVVIEFVG